MKVPAIRKQTDNFSIEKKQALRKQATSHLEELRVLDCYGGNNNMWKSFQLKEYYSIEVVKGKGANVYGDNRKIIPVLDLSKFNVIDLDSYGYPIEQLELCFDNPTLKKGTVIIYTAIGNSISALSKKLIKKMKIEKMYKKCPTLFNNKGRQFFHAFLYLNGIRSINYFRADANTSFEKEYGYFIY